MQQRYTTIVLLAFIGFMLGLLLFTSQSALAASMNPLGVVAFGSLGACVGCLLADHEESRR